MSKGVKLRREGNQLEKLALQIERLDGQKVEVGHFKEQGMHPSGYSYPELMAFHHNGGDPNNDEPVPPRPILDYLWANNLALGDAKIKAAFLAWGSRPPSNNSNAKLLDDIGKVLAQKERDVFGKSPPLAPNSPHTANPTQPMVETGDLRAHVSHRDSLNKIVRR